MIGLSQNDLSGYKAEKENRFVLEDGSNKDFVYVIHFGKDENVETEIVAGNNCTLNMHVFCEGTVSHNINVKIGENSSVKISFAVLCGKSVKTNLEVDFNGENSEFDCPVILMPFQDEKIEFQSVINHNVSRCKSNQIVRAVVDKNGVSDFYGLVKVAPNAQKTESGQVNNNILLSENARALSKPQLEINADDVKCSHGSTTGMLDKNAIFYMRSRGISEKEAQNLMLQAFINEVTDSLNNPKYEQFLKEKIAVKLS